MKEHNSFPFDKPNKSWVVCVELVSVTSFFSFRMIACYGSSPKNDGMQQHQEVNVKVEIFIVLFASL